MKKGFHKICYVLLLVFGMANAQTKNLSVQVNESATGQPLQSTEIAISPCQCGGLTNAVGSFSIALPEARYRITITYIGYNVEIRDVVLDKDIALNIVLSEKQEQLSEVIVRAKERNENLIAPQMGVVGLTQRELKMIPTAVGEFDVLRAITLLPGVNNAGEISNGISVRGGSLDQNLILYDYAPVFNPTHLFGLFSVFTPDVISSSELYRANIPSRYGGRSTSVLDIKV
ncbi:unnamed protein product, partial [Ectocarpus sp. 12 AP-2014]